MADATAEFFDQLARRGHEPLLAKADGTMRFDLLRDGQAEHRFVTINHGNVQVTQQDAAADCVLRADRNLFNGFVTGEVNAMTAFLRGAVSVEGDLELTVRFQRLFPGPQDAR